MRKHETSLGVDAGIMGLTAAAVANDALTADVTRYVPVTGSLSQIAGLALRFDVAEGEIWLVDVVMCSACSRTEAVRFRRANYGLKGRLPGSVTVGSLYLKPGEYLVCDPCYCCEAEPYDEILALSFPYSEALEGRNCGPAFFFWRGGFVTGTLYGDGTYRTEVETDDAGQVDSITVWFGDDPDQDDYDEDEYEDRYCEYCGEELGWRGVCPHCDGNDDE